MEDYLRFFSFFGACIVCVHAVPQGHGAVVHVGENIGKVLSLFCLPGPALAALPVPDLDLAPGPAPGEWGAMHTLC